MSSKSYTARKRERAKKYQHERYLNDLDYREKTKEANRRNNFIRAHNRAESLFNRLGRNCNKCGSPLNLNTTIVDLGKDTPTITLKTLTRQKDWDKTYMRLLCLVCDRW